MTTLLDEDAPIGATVRYNDDPCYYLGRCDREDEGIVGHDVKLRPTRLGPGEYTFVGAPDAAELLEVQ